jgi:hypothetical protein
MTVPSLIDADDRAIRCELLQLLREGVVEEHEPAVQKHNRCAMAESLA